MAVSRLMLTRKLIFGTVWKIVFEEEFAPWKACSQLSPTLWVQSLMMAGGKPEI